MGETYDQKNCGCTVPLRFLGATDLGATDPRREKAAVVPLYFWGLQILGKKRLRLYQQKMWFYLTIFGRYRYRGEKTAVIIFWTTNPVKT